MTSDQIGKKLKKLGLRSTDGKPSRAAFQGGFCGQRWTHDHEKYCWAWHAEKTCDVLRRAGLGAAGQSPPPTGSTTGQAPRPGEVYPPAR
jgi:hypothetical protein